MPSVVVSLLHSLRFVVHSRAALHLEILALRHQVAVMHRARPACLPLGPWDRLRWAWLSRVWGCWRIGLHIVPPATA